LTPYRPYQIICWFSIRVSTGCR